MTLVTCPHCEGLGEIQEPDFASTLDVHLSPMQRQLVNTLHKAGDIGLTYVQLAASMYGHRDYEIQNERQALAVLVGQTNKALERVEWNIDRSESKWHKRIYLRKR